MMDVREIGIHGRRLTYRVAGEGPTLLLIHGITQDSSTWDDLVPSLRAHHRIIAPDLPGHGLSQAPEGGDHSLGAYASALRDLLLALEIPSATIAGHSLGGGVALQFSYQFPDLLDRLILIDSGGLGRDVSPVLRAAALPGASLVLRLLTSDAVTGTAGAVARALRGLGLQSGTDLREMGRGVKGLSDPEKRRAFVRTVNAVIAPSGQSVSARKKLYLAREVPTLIVWGTRDRIIPLRHGAVAHQMVEGSRLRVIEGAGHFPHLDAPDELAEHIRTFIDETEPFDIPQEEWAEILRSRGELEQAQ